MSKQNISSAPKAVNNDNEFLTFMLANEEYGIDIIKVQEIRGYGAVTAIANAPGFIKGVVNLRGNIVPIVDLRVKFNLKDIRYDEFTVVIILNIAERVIGIVVDSVSDVITLAPEKIMPVPEFSSSFDTKYLLGLGATDQRMLILVDIERLMTSREMELINEAVA